MKMFVENLESILVKNDAFNIPEISINKSYYISKTHLNDIDSAILDNGDLLPELAYFWMDLGRFISYELTLPSGIIYPKTKEKYSLELDILCRELYSNNWSHQNFFIAWGAVSNQSMVNLHNYQGIIYPIFDGIGFTIQTSKDFFELFLNKFDQYFIDIKPVSY